MQLYFQLKKYRLLILHTLTIDGLPLGPMYLNFSKVHPTYSYTPPSSSSASSVCLLIMNRLWHIPPLQLQKSYRGVGDSCTHNCLSYIPSSSRIQIELASVYAMAPGKRLPLQWSQWESCCHRLPSHTLWIKCRGIWTKGCIPMSTLEVCSFGIV